MPTILNPSQSTRKHFHHDLWPDAGDDKARPHANEIIRKSCERGRIHGVTVKAAHNAGYVPDRESAEFLASIFDGSTVEKLSLSVPESLTGKGRPGRHRIHQSDADRKKAYRDRHEILMAKTNRNDSGTISSKRLLDFVPTNRNGILPESEKATSPSLLPSAQGHRPRRHQSDADRQKAYRARQKAKKDSWTLLPEIPLQSAHKTACGTLLPDLYKDPLGYFQEESIFPFLRDRQQRILATKEENHLFTPAVFDPNQGDGYTKKGLQNIVYMGGFIGFDFEDGQLSPETVAQIFSDNQHWISNSFRHTPEAPRFHAFFPLDGCVTKDEYRFFWEQIVIRIEDAGYSVGKDRPGMKLSGMDTGKRAPSSLYYQPCQAKDPEASFSIECKDQLPINRAEWLSNPVYPSEGSYVCPETPRIVREAPAKASDHPVDLIAVQEAKDRWRATPKGWQNAAFNQLAWDLWKAWMPVWDIELTLHEELAHANHPEERRKQINPIIKKMRA